MGKGGGLSECAFHCMEIDQKTEGSSCAKVLLHTDSVMIRTLSYRSEMIATFHFILNLKYLAATTINVKAGGH